MRQPDPNQRPPRSTPDGAIEQREQPGYYPGFSTLAQQGFWDAATRATVLKRLEPPPPVRFFTAEEERTMQAVTERLLPQDDRVPERRIAIVPAIDERLFTNRIEGYRYEDMPSDQDAYRLAVRGIEEMAQHHHGRAFHDLESEKQECILKSLHDGKPMEGSAVWQQMSVARMWSLLLSDCCSAYYAHPWAWDEVGYGGPAYPRGYMRLEEGEPEPWEVEERRYEWEAPAGTITDNAEEAAIGEHATHPGQAGTH